LFPGTINVESLTIPRSFSRILWLARPSFDHYKTSSEIDWFTPDVLLVVEPASRDKLLSLIDSFTVTVNICKRQYTVCSETCSNNWNLYGSL